MNTDVAQKWIDALRSGEYEQAREMLHVLPDPEDPEDERLVGYCCLGVLCDLAVKEGVIEQFNGWNAYPPDDVAGWLGVDPGDSDGPKPDGSFWQRCAFWNDNEHMTFEQIAERLEEVADLKSTPDTGADTT